MKERRQGARKLVRGREKSERAGVVRVIRRTHAVNTHTLVVPIKDTRALATVIFLHTPSTTHSCDTHTQTHLCDTHTIAHV